VRDNLVSCSLLISGPNLVQDQPPFPLPARDRQFSVGTMGVKARACPIAQRRAAALTPIVEAEQSQRERAGIAQPSQSRFHRLAARTGRRDAEADSRTGGAECLNGSPTRPGKVLCAVKKKRRAPRRMPSRPSIYCSVSSKRATSSSSRPWMGGVARACTTHDRPSLPLPRVHIPFTAQAKRALMPSTKLRRCGYLFASL
jgi:hypothetical protein